MILNTSAHNSRVEAQKMEVEFLSILLQQKRTPIFVLETLSQKVLIKLKNLEPGIRPSKFLYFCFLVALN